MIYPEIDSAFHVKIMLCFILDKIARPVSEDLLHEIIDKSEVINYFYYAESLEELIKNEAVSKTDGVISLNEKGKLSSDYFNSYIPKYFHSRLLKSAYSLFSKIAIENETDVSIMQTQNGYEVSAAVKDVSFDLMRMSFYAPDKSQADLIKAKILKNPTMFYQKVIEYLLENKEEY